MDGAKIKNTFLNFLVPLGCLAGSALLFFIIIYPSIRRTPLLKQEIEANTVLRDNLSDKKNRLERLKDFQSIVEENSALVDKAVPAEKNVPGLLDQVDQIASESGLDITKLSYSLSDTGGPDSEITYQSVLISLGADGTFDQMVAFFEAIENAARVVSITNVRYNLRSTQNDVDLSFTFILNAPYLSVSSAAVTDEALALDLSSQEFIDFINKIKGLRYFEKSGDELLRDLAEEVSIEELEGSIDGDTEDSDLEEEETAGNELPVEPPVAEENLPEEQLIGR